MSSPGPAIAIIGAGFGGLCAAIKLKQAGFRSLTVFDKATRAGGTWQANTYPGVECDVPSHLYSYSFRLNGDWSRKWSPQTEILAYIDDCIRHYGIDEHLRLGCEVVTCEFDDATTRWTLTDADGVARAFDFVIFALGQLSRPRRPEIPGLDGFRGDCFHSSEWRHDCDLGGRSVAVLGNAASAVQLVPPVANVAAHLTVFQRSANWMLRKNNRRYLPVEKWLARHVPGVARMYRLWIWLYAETFVYPLTGENRTMKSIAGRLTRRFMEECVHDESKRACLIPDYPFGAKRILFSDNYYAALDRDNVSIETSPVTRIADGKIECADGSRHMADALILATGFNTTDFLAPVAIVGRDGTRLEDAWRDGAQAYLGIATAGFPNLFMMYGPNTNLGHSSIISMLECQARYIAACLRRLRASSMTRVEVRRAVQDDYNRRLQERLGGKVWADIAESWYLRNGRNTNNWPGTTVEYWWRTRRFNAGDFAIN